MTKNILLVLLGGTLSMACVPPLPVSYCKNSDSCPQGYSCDEQAHYCYPYCSKDQPCPSGFFCEPKELRCYLKLDGGTEDSDLFDAAPLPDHFAQRDMGQQRDRVAHRDTRPPTDRLHEDRAIVERSTQDSAYPDSYYSDVDYLDSYYSDVYLDSYYSDVYLDSYYSDVYIDSSSDTYMEASVYWDGNATPDSYSDEASYGDAYSTDTCAQPEVTIENWNLDKTCQLTVAGSVVLNGGQGNITGQLSPDFVQVGATATGVTGHYMGDPPTHFTATWSVSNGCGFSQTATQPLSIVMGSGGIFTTPSAAPQGELHLDSMVGRQAWLPQTAHLVGIDESCSGESGRRGSLALGSEHSCVLTYEGDILCWGDNSSYQLGANIDSIAEPNQVADDTKQLLDVVAVATGGEHTCALLHNSAMCWGNNSDGQLGYSYETGDTSHQPHIVNDDWLDSSVSLTGIVALAAGGYHTCALMQEGVVKCWGRNTSGQLGNGTFATLQQHYGVCLTAPCDSEMGDTIAIAAGESHTCAILDPLGRVMCWGDNSHGQLGTGAITASQPLPQPVFTQSDSVPPSEFPLQDAVALAAGNTSTCALLKTGEVYCWGQNTQGQLGSDHSTGEACGSNVCIPYARPVCAVGSDGTNCPSLDNAIAVAAGRSHACALLDNQRIACWGSNAEGQLGIGSATGATVVHPTAVCSHEGCGSTLESMISIAAAENSTCAQGSGGGLLCWGADTSGQLGNGPPNVRQVLPTAVCGAGCEDPYRGCAHRRHVEFLLQSQ